MKKVTIIMYHYVRDLKHSRFPEIKGLDIQLFQKQLEYLKANYNFTTIENIVESLDNVAELPAKAVLLTFDDGYIDHFQSVFQILNENGLQGCFYPPAKALKEHTVLDVNKIHFILASVNDKQKIINSIYKILNDFRKDYDLESNEHYFNKLAHANRFDTKDVSFIKRLLQIELKEQIRKNIIDMLFVEFVGISEEILSKELYMSIDQIKCMRRNGMHIGSHGFDHYWLDSLSKEKQENEIGLSVDFLKKIGADPSYFTLSYP